MPIYRTFQTVQSILRGFVSALSFYLDFPGSLKTFTIINFALAIIFHDMNKTVIMVCSVSVEGRRSICLTGMSGTMS